MSKKILLRTFTRQPAVRCLRQLRVLRSTCLTSLRPHTVSAGVSASWSTASVARTLVSHSVQEQSSLVVRVICDTVYLAVDTPCSDP